MHRLLLVIALAVVTMTDCAPGRAADPLGFYVGAGVGRAQVHSDVDFSSFGVAGFYGLHSISGGPTGWKLMAGIRPLSTLGAEVAYMDFGSGARSLPGPPDVGGLTATSHPKAVALLAVGYLPIPLPHLDLFAKAGVTELRRDIRGQFTCGFIAPPCLSTVASPSSGNGTTTHPAYGAGAQLRLASLAVSAEYERISAGSGDVDLLSLGLTFAF